MSAYEVWKVAAAVIASLGGGGAIVFGLSGYLGKIWADRGLEKQKQEYTKLNIEFSNQLQVASKQLQVELDRLGLLNKLRTESEFQELVELWKTIARLRFAFNKLPTKKYDLQVPDQAGPYHQIYVKASEEFVKCWSEAFEIWNEKALSIPENILQMSAQLLTIATKEEGFAGRYPDPFDGSAFDLFDEKTLADFMAKRSKNADDFGGKSVDLLSAMRKHLQGSSTRPATNVE